MLIFPIKSTISITQHFTLRKKNSNKFVCFFSAFFLTFSFIKRSDALPDATLLYTRACDQQYI